LDFTDINNLQMTTTATSKSSTTSKNQSRNRRTVKAYGRLNWPLRANRSFKARRPRWPWRRWRSSARWRQRRERTPATQPRPTIQRPGS